jgi:hypothetical protein
MKYIIQNDKTYQVAQIDGDNFYAYGVGWLPLLKTYEIFTHTFSKPVEAGNILDALVLFYLDYPKEKVIKAEEKGTCSKSCGPGDFRKGGKCDTSGCYY